MIEATKVKARLDEMRALMELLGDRKLGGVAIVVPPEGDGVELVVHDDRIESKHFYALLFDRMKAAVEANRYGGVNMPPGMGLR